MAEESYDSSLFPSATDAKNAESAWNSGQEEAEKGQPVGTFQAIIKEAELGRSSSSDRLQIHYSLEIANGEFKGVELHKYDGLETSQQASITQQQLNRLGVNTKNLSLNQLPAALLDLVDKTVQIRTKKNGEYYNIYFQRLMTEPVASGAGADKGAKGGKAKRAF